MITKELRKMGISIIGDATWGTHFCQFYRTGRDLLDILVPYFKAGLENNEFCMWITAEPLGVEEAKDAMAKAMSDFYQYEEKGQIAIMPHTEWYLKDGGFESQRVLNGWVEKLEQALANGYAGLRLTSNTFWLERKDWKSFTDYEAEINNVIRNYRMLALCTYCLDKCNANEIIDVVRNHKFALIKQEGEWEVIENSTYKKTKEALSGALEELQQRNQEILALLEGSRAVLTHKEFKSSARALFDSCQNLIGATGGYVALLSKDGTENEVQFLESGGRSCTVDPTLPMPIRGLRGEVYRTGKATYHNGFTESKWAQFMPAGHVSLDNVMFAPLVLEGKVYGLLGLANKPGGFTENDAKIATAFGGLAAVALLNSRMLESLETSERILRQSEANYRTLVESSPDGIISLDFEGHIIDCNESFCTLIGFTREEIRNKELHQFLMNVPRRKMRTYQAMLDEKGQFETEFTAINRQGEAVSLWAKAVSVNNPNRGFGRTVVYVRDITERKKLEQLKDEFIGLVSHELRTPLTVITGCLSTVITEWERLPSGEVLQLLKDAMLESESLAHIIENPLELSRFQAKQLTLYAEPINLRALVGEQVNKIKPQAPSHRFIISIPDGLPLVKADPLRVERILYNLLENATKYSSQGSQIKVSAKVELECLVIGVSDKGRGLSSSEQAKLFSPFQRLEQAKLAGTRGVGLGLMVCRRLVEAHGGHIWVGSEPGWGSTFFFTLPLEHKN